jgi:lipopolysaccharide export LptBFGC system permease protein LptF
MRLLDRYLLRELFVPLGYCLGFFFIFFISFDLIGSLNRFQEHQLTLGDVVDLYVVKLPEIIVFILPIALLVSLLYAITNHARYHELTAIRAAGISLMRICVPYFIVGLLLSLVVFALNEFWVPDSQAKQNQIMDRRTNPASVNSPLQSKLGFRNDRDDRTWFMGTYDSRNEIMWNPEVMWKERGYLWQLNARSAQREDGVWTFYGTTAFSTNDIENLDALAGALKNPTNAISQYMAGELSPETQVLLKNYTNGPDADLQRSLTKDLNQVIRGPLYSATRFVGVNFSPETVSLLAQNPESGFGLPELNHWLLTDAFPQSLSTNAVNSVNLLRGGVDSDFKMDPFVNTNRIALPEFSETPRLFANEARFSQRLSGKLSTDSAEFPIAEIHDYLEIHPQVSQKYRWWLTTQLYGRYATPWECLVVVIIAIPFGAGSGRRNVFVGVASSIAICLVYLVVQRLALALGTGGFLPGWLAAWLPNVVFSITGFWLMLRVR